MRPETTTNDTEKAIISGHYIFSTPEFINLKKKILHHSKDPDDFDKYLKTEIKNSIKKYLVNLKLI